MEYETVLVALAPAVALLCETEILRGILDCGDALPCAQRERERLQCFSQPASLITYRRRQRSNVENIKTVQNELENLHMILLCKKGVCVRGKQRSIPLPNCLESWTLKNHVQFICNNHTTTMCADPIGSGNMLTPSKTPENNWQLMRAQPTL